MEQLVFEGTWEEIALYAPQLTGRQLKVMTVDAAEEEAFPAPAVHSQEQLEALLLEGLHSGPPIEATAEYWQQKEARLMARLQQGQTGA